MKKSVIFLGLLLLSGCASPSKSDEDLGEKPMKPTANQEINQRNAMTQNSNVIVEDLKVGDGKIASPGAKVSVHYVGTLENGTKFDSSRDRGEPFVFTLGAGQVIQGWDQGIAGMKVGGTRKLNIPPELAYGGRAVGQIPPNSTLVFEVELLEAN